MKNYLLLFAILSVCNVAFAQNLVLQKLQKKFNSINTLSADFEQISRMTEKNKSLVSKGKLYYQKENKYRIEFKNIELISDGITIWNFNKHTNKVVINSLTNDPNSFSLKNIIIDLPVRSKVESLEADTIAGQKCYVTLLTSLKGEQSFRSVKIWSDNKDLIRRIEMADHNGFINIFELSGLKINQKIPAGKFNLEIPEGTETVDLR
ncbi:MAG: outer membrane lipoprotein carrier protein LolA [Ignavibacteria bacterium]